MATAEEIIRFLGMKPLPGEGGFYVETYRSGEKIALDALPQRYTARKSLSTAILYLLAPCFLAKARRGLTPDTFSALHRLASDEIFHFYLGDAVTMLQLGPDGSSEIITLGHDILNGQRIQVTVPQGVWQGCFLNQGGRFALMGTTVAPGFDFADYEAAGRKELLQQYPAHRDLIIRLTRP